MAAVIFAIDDEPLITRVCLLFAGLLALAIPGIARATKYRRNAETVHAQALRLLASSRGAR
ncbi:hypothetical protein [Kibdelosporangium persicum]|uniref:hypothetical protein n=1 Tax=Kibdelosporangium persicum TaxID=2698649 RepID=UPI001567248C|nr:hypothetical protein [Kibdelosporangium persicum]